MDQTLFPISRRECEGALLSVAAAARSVLEQEERCVLQARRAGMSWERIAAPLGCSAERLRSRYGRHEAELAAAG